MNTISGTREVTPVCSTHAGFCTQDLCSTPCQPGKGCCWGFNQPAVRHTAVCHLSLARTSPLLQQPTQPMDDHHSSVRQHTPQHMLASPAQHASWLLTARVPTRLMFFRQFKQQTHQNNTNNSGQHSSVPMIRPHGCSVSKDTHSGSLLLRSPDSSKAQTRP